MLLLLLLLLLLLSLLFLFNLLLLLFLLTTFLRKKTSGYKSFVTFARDGSLPRRLKHTMNRTPTQLYLMFLLHVFGNLSKRHSATVRHIVTRIAMSKRRVLLEKFFDCVDDFGMIVDEPRPTDTPHRNLLFPLTWTSFLFRFIHLVFVARK